MDLGYTTTSLGMMLSFTPRHDKILRTGGFNRLMEAIFTYKFWVVYCTWDDDHHYQMERFALWDRRSLAWEGFCSQTQALGTQSAEALG